MGEGTNGLPGPLTVLSPKDQDAFLAIGRPVAFARGDLLMRQGEEPGDLLIVTAGRVASVATAVNGKELMLALHGPGDFIGDLSVLDGQPRTATIQAMQDGEAVRIPGPVFRATLPKVPPLALALLQLAALRLRRTNARVLEQVADDIATRLARRLMEIAARHSQARDDGALELTMPLTQDQLATWVGATREATAKSLATLRKDKVVEVSRGSLAILDLDALRQIAAY